MLKRNALDYFNVFAGWYCYATISQGLIAAIFFHQLVKDTLICLSKHAHQVPMSRNVYILSAVKPPWVAFSGHCHPFPHQNLEQPFLGGVSFQREARID